MEWNYKGIEITIDEQGYFNFEDSHTAYCTKSLEEAKKRIDDLTIKRFSFDDLQIMLRKLKENEQDFVKEMIHELSRHEYNAYCEMGISDSFPYDTDFEHWSANL